MFCLSLADSTENDLCLWCIIPKLGEVLNGDVSVKKILTILDLADGSIV